MFYNKIILDFEWEEQSITRSIFLFIVFVFDFTFNASIIINQYY